MLRQDAFVSCPQRFTINFILRVISCECCVNIFLRTSEIVWWTNSWVGAYHIQFGTNGGALDVLVSQECRMDAKGKFSKARNKTQWPGTLLSGLGKNWNLSLHSGVAPLEDTRWNDGEGLRLSFLQWCLPKPTSASMISSRWLGVEPRAVKIWISLEITLNTSSWNLVLKNLSSPCFEICPYKLTTPQRFFCINITLKYKLKDEI